MGAVAHPEQPSDPAPLRLALAHGTAAYVDEGQGPAIVAVHGIPGSLRDFRWLAPALREHFRFVRVDLPGFGDTPWATRAGYSPGDRASFVLEVIEALGLERPLVLGHSMGGVVATAMAAQAQDKLRGLIFVASPGTRAHRAFRRLPRRTLSAWFAHPLRRKLLMPVLKRGFALGGFRGPYPDQTLIHTLHGVAAVDFGVHAQRLHALSLPCAVVWTEDDPLIEPEIPAELARFLPAGPRLCFAHGGHNPQKHQALELADALRGWHQVLPQ